MWTRACRALLDVVLPGSCPACEGPGGDETTGGLCRACCARLPPAVLRCPRCGYPCGPHRVDPGCPRCRTPGAGGDALRFGETRPGPLRCVVVGQGYAGTARDLVIALKFRRRLSAAALLADPMVGALRRADVPGDVLVPVPLSRKRHRRRGFNQALALARPISRALGLELDARVLRRRRHDAPQSGRTRAQRRRAPRGAFEALRGRLAGRCPILVDDVLTSGATARACALALRRAGAASVALVVACRAEPS